MEDLEIDFVTVVTRHGLRTPLKVSPHFQNVWDCVHQHKTPLTFSIQKMRDATPIELPKESNVDEKNKTLPGTCYLGQLTPKGIEQSKELGESFKQRYIEDLKLLEKDLKPSQLYIRSTYYTRTVETAQYILEGMYKENQKKEIVIHIKDEEEENMYPRSGCKRLRELRREIEASNDYKQFEKSLEPLRKQIQKAIRVSDPNYPTSWAGLQNTLHTLEMHEMSPKDLDQEIKDKVDASSAKAESFRYKNKEAVRLGIGRFFGDIIHKMDEKVEGKSETRFAMFSGHDNTLFPMLNGLEITDGKHPKMGSYLAFELYKYPNSVKNPERYVRIVYNDRVFNLAQCKPFERKGYEGLCPYSEFKKIVNPLVPVNYTEECKVTSSK